jgi:molecular chaperone GrpE
VDDDELIKQDDALEASPAGEPAHGNDAIAAEAPVESMESLRAALESARAEAEQYRQEFLRAKADGENLRKRSLREVENAHKYGLERFIGEFLPVKDSMELGLEAARTAESVDSVREGLEMTLKMFAAALGKLGLEEIDPAGEKFDPEFHQAMTTGKAPGVESGTVLDVVQKGYCLNGRLVRPALVVVAAEPDVASS